MTAQHERTLQSEIMLRLRAGAFPVIAIPVPNGLWIPARTDDEKAIIARIIARMKADGLLLPGAPDLVIAGARGALFAELKRPAAFDLIARKPAGRLSKSQSEIQKRCHEIGVNYIVARGWEDLQPAIRELY